MLKFRDIRAEDKPLFDKYRPDGMIASEAAFSTMYIWNDYYNLKVAEQGGFLFYQFNIKDRIPSYYFPLGHGDAAPALDALKEYTHGKGHIMAFRLVTEEQLSQLRSYRGAEFLANEERDCEDYVYTSASLISLAGKKLHAKRNHVNFFQENYQYTYESVDRETALNECAPLMYSLVEGKDHNLDPFEIKAMKRFFDNYETLGERGAVIRVNGEIVAMSFGEPLNDKAAVIQIEVARDEFRGAYQMINKLFCENEWKDYVFINREEDMGLEGLRKAKESYHPEFLVKKFTVIEI